MKNMKKIIAVLMSLTAITMTTSAFAAEGKGTATYDEGAVTLSAEGLPTDANTQLTVVIVPTGLGEKAITSGDIYYINQGAAGEEFNAIIAEMKVKDGADFATNTYEVRIGGALTDDYYVYTITGEEAEEILYGDVNGNGSVNALDVRDLKRHLASWEGYEADVLNMAAADVNGNGSANALDVRDIKRHLASWEGYETLPVK